MAPESHQGLRVLSRWAAYTRQGQLSVGHVLGQASQAVNSSAGQWPALCHQLRWPGPGGR